MTSSRKAAVLARSRCGTTLRRMSSLQGGAGVLASGGARPGHKCELGSAAWSACRLRPPGAALSALAADAPRATRIRRATLLGAAAAAGRGVKVCSARAEPRQGS